MHKLPFLYVRFGRNYVNMEGWSLSILFAPFPAEEQVPGRLIGALLNGRIDFIPRPPFLRFDLYTPRRDRR